LARATSILGLLLAPVLAASVLAPAQARAAEPSVAPAEAPKPADAPPPEDPPFRRSENPLIAPAAQEAPKPTGQLTKPPELLKFVEAPFPQEAQDLGLQGSVGLLVDIDDKGAVTKVEVTEPAGHGFDEAAVEAVRQFQFAPAEIDGKPAPVRIAYHYNFTLQKQEPPPPTPEEKAAEVTLRGTLLQRGNRVPINGASVSVDEGRWGAMADEKGHFEIAGIPVGPHQVVVAAAGFEKYETDEEVVENKVTEVTYYVRKQVFTPYETVVRGKREKKDVARVELRQEEIRLIAGTGGDAFRVVQDLPGVARVPYSFGLLVVRGGRPQDTRVYLDGVWIPIMFHFAGLTAVYNSDLLQELTFLPGNFGAHDGRAMGGVVEATSRTPSKEAFHGYANISLLDSTLLIEGPLSENWSFAAAGRVSYVDVVLQEFLPSSVQFMTAPRYWDYQAKAEWAPKNGKDRVSLQYFGGHDLMQLLATNAAMIDPEGRNDVGASADFQRLVLTWKHRVQAGLDNKLTVGLGTDNATSNIGGDIHGELMLYNLQLRDALNWEISPSLSIEAGTDTYVGYYDNDVTSPPFPRADEIPDPVASRQLIHSVDSGILFEPSIFVDASWKPFQGTRIVPGVRLDYEGTLNYFTVDPRLTLFQQIVEGTILKGAVGLYSQPPDFRFQQWSEKLGNPHLQAEHSISAMLGLEQRITDSLHLDVQLYYKHLWNLLWSSTNTVERGGQTVLERYDNSGLGRAYGFEIMLRQELTSRFFGWIAYSYGRTERRSTVLERQKNWFYGAYDQPHHLIVVASYKLPYDFVAGLRFQYVSGNLATPYGNAVYDADSDMFMAIPGETNSVRGPDFISLDLRVDKRFVFQQWSVNVFLDVQNVTNNKNSEFILYNYDYTKSQYVMGMPIFPTLGIKAEF
jgi:TonB family protein